MATGPLPADWRAVNRRSWNAATCAHNAHKRDQAAFLRDGGSTLFPEEVALLGDLRGKRLLHLQCNAGQDTLSLARLGAIVTGVDISDEAIAFARQLADDAGIAATFHCADVYEWLPAAAERGETYDVVFCSYGALCWLSDLERWAREFVALLVPGGRFVTVEFHPAAMIFDEQWRVSLPYFGQAGEAVKWADGVSDYVGAAGATLAPSGFVEAETPFVNPHPVYEFQWHLGAIFQALLGAGLRIEHFAEYPYSNGARLFEGMRAEGARLYPPAHVAAVPLMFSLGAQLA